MATLDVYSQDKKKTGTIDLNDEVFGVEVNAPLVHQVIKAQLAGRRRGTAKVKTKAEVVGSNKKLYKQKGTGNARRGAAKSNILVGGGQAHGPRPRSYEQATPKEMIRGALRSALSDRVKSDRVLVIDQFDLKDAKTKAFDRVLKKGLDLQNALIVDEANRNLELSGRNIPNVKVLRVEGINVYDIVRYEWLVMTKRAIQAVEARLAKK